jgi:hypothetical protein
MADGFHSAAAPWAAVAAVIVAAIAAATATSVASGFRTARFAPEGECLSDQRACADEGKSDQSKEISFHVYCLLFKALDS